jgi:hypothetical protein
MTRRLVLKTLLVLVGALAALLVLWRPWRLTQLVGRALRPRLDSSSPTGVLSDQEMGNVVAFAEVLVDGASLPSASRDDLIEHVNDRTRTTPGYLPLYRRTAALLDRLAGARFVTLGLEARAAVLTRHRLTAYDVRTREYLLPFRRTELAVRSLVVPDLIAGHYGSAAGWAVVGYQAFPGRCSDLTRYTRPEA